MRAGDFIVSEDVSSSSMKSLIRGFVDFTSDEIWSAIMDAEPMQLPTFVKPKGDTEEWLLRSCAPALAKAIIKDERFEQVFYDNVKQAMKDYFEAMLEDKR